MNNINELKNVVKLDVRDDIKSGLDPFKKIMETINALKEGAALEITNSFEPFPLYSVLKHKGFEHMTERTEEGFKIVFYRDKITGGGFEDKTGRSGSHKISEDADEKNFDDDDLKNLAHKSPVEIDIRGLEPPQPLLKIFEKLESLKEDEALYITHERKPIHLYPRLKDAGYRFLTEESGDELYTIKVWK